VQCRAPTPQLEVGDERREPEGHFEIETDRRIPRGLGRQSKQAGRGSDEFI
jgi:hypothetical protein